MKWGSLWYDGDSECPNQPTYTNTASWDQAKLFHKSPNNIVSASTMYDHTPSSTSSSRSSASTIINNGPEERSAMTTYSGCHSQVNTDVENNQYHEISKLTCANYMCYFLCMFFITGCGAMIVVYALFMIP